MGASAQQCEVEAAKCYTDDVLLYRMTLLQVVAQMGRDVRLGQDSKLRLNPKVCFLLEQPAEPGAQFPIPDSGTTPGGGRWT